MALAKSAGTNPNQRSSPASHSGPLALDATRGKKRQQTNKGAARNSIDSRKHSIITAVALDCRIYRLHGSALGAEPLIAMCMAAHRSASLALAGVS